MRRKVIYHGGPTNSGKTYHALEALRGAKTVDYSNPNSLAPRAPGLVPEGTNFPTPTGVAKGLSEPMGGIFCGPLRLLALEVYEDMNARGVYCSLLTGQERKEVPFADHVSCTIEMVNINRAYDVAVIDEIQMIGSPQRGHAWTRALLG